MFASGIVLVALGAEEVAKASMTAGILTILVLFPLLTLPETAIRYPERKAKAEAKQKQRESRLTIVEVHYLGIHKTKRVRGGLKGAFLGGFFGGIAGAMVGAMLPENEKELHRFTVTYADGHTAIRDIPGDSHEFQKLWDLVTWDSA